MAEATADSAEETAKTLGGTDKWYNKLAGYLSNRISAFVAFLFMLFAAGAFYGAFLVARLPELEMYLLLAPLVLALLAYHSRGFATLAFIGLLLFVFVSVSYTHLTLPTN